MPTRHVESTPAIPGHKAVKAKLPKSAAREGATAGHSGNRHAVRDGCTGLDEGTQERERQNVTLCGGWKDDACDYGGIQYSPQKGRERRSDPTKDERNEDEKRNDDGKPTKEIDLTNVNSEEEEPVEGKRDWILQIC